MPSCSIIIPTYNRAELTIRAVNSVYAQTYKDFELIVVDDGSDEDQEDLKKILNNIGAKYLRKENGGVASARNYGIKNSATDILFFLDSDDEWLGEKLEKQMDYFLNNPECHILQTLERWYRFGNLFQVPTYLMPVSGDAFRMSLDRCCIGPSSVGLKKSIIKDIGYFNENLRICEDYEYWIRVSLHHNIHLISEELIIKYYGTHLQLSNSEIALDRFRVYALFGILIRFKEEQIKLSEEQLLDLFDALLRKTRVLLNGAIKRGLNEEITIYEEVLRVAQDRIIDNNLYKVFKVLEKTIQEKLRNN